MTEIELPQFPDANLLTHSREACHKTCPRKHYLQYVLGLRPAHNGDPLRRGSMWHLGVGMIESGTDPADAVSAVRQAYADTPRPPWMEAEEEYDVECEMVVAMVLGHQRRWQTDAILETVAVELPFQVAIINPETGGITPTYLSAGQIDRIARLPDGRLALVERKTTSESLEQGGDYFQRLLLDSQISRYVLAARAIGHDVQTTVYDVIRTPMIRPKAISKSDRAMATSDGDYFGHPLTARCPERETPELYGARLLADMQERPDFYFTRVEIPRLESDLDEYRREQWIVQKQIRDAELKTREWGASAWPRNTGACNGMYACPFLPICRSTTQPTNDIPQGFRRVAVLHEELR